MKIKNLTPAICINKSQATTKNNQSFKAAHTDIDGHIRNIIDKSDVNRIYSVCRGYEDNVYVSVCWDWYDRENHTAHIKTNVTIQDKKNGQAGYGVARAYSVKPNSSDIMSVIPGLISSAYNEAKSKMQEYKDRTGENEWDEYITHCFKHYGDTEERWNAH